MKQLKYYLSFSLVILLIFSVSCAATSKQESTGEYIDDSVLTTKIKTAVFNEPSLKSTEIKVITYKGVVQLSGFVTSEDNIKKALEVVSNVDGVKSIKNDMHVK
jgi:osmotically-inducible protein OsmY